MPTLKQFRGSKSNLEIEVRGSKSKFLRERQTSILLMPSSKFEVAMAAIDKGGEEACEVEELGKFEGSESLGAWPTTRDQEPKCRSKRTAKDRAEPLSQVGSAVEESPEACEGGKGTATPPADKRKKAIDGSNGSCTSAEEPTHGPHRDVVTALGGRLKLRTLTGWTSMPTDCLEPVLNE